MQDEPEITFKRVVSPPSSYTTTTLYVNTNLAQPDVALFPTADADFEENLKKMLRMKILYIPEMYTVVVRRYCDEKPPNDNIPIKLQIKLLHEVDTYYKLYTHPVEYMMMRPIYGRTQNTESRVYESIDLFEATDVFENALKVMLDNIGMFLAGKKSAKNPGTIFSESADAHLSVWARAMAAHARLTRVSGGGSDHETSIKSLKSTVFAPIYVMRMQIRTGVVRL
jgi:hypothetical protein